MATKTHVEIKDPKISVRYLADYMAGSERAKRSIVSGCKYQPIARLIQHDEAKEIVSEFICSGMESPEPLYHRANALRERVASDDFDRTVLDINADYVKRYADISALVSLPDATVLPTKKFVPLILHGVRVPFAPNFLLRRTTKTNKIKVGAAMLRYAKGSALAPEKAAYQTAIILGAMRSQKNEGGEEPDPALCLVIDAYRGTVYPAPSNATSRFQNAKAACASIAERWPAIKPPPGSVL